MKLKGIKEKIDFSIIILIFTYGIIGSKQILINGNYIQVEMVAVLSIYLLISEIRWCLKNKEEFKEIYRNNKFLFVALIGIFILNIIYTIILKNNSVFYVINKYYPYVFFMVIYLNLKRKKSETIDRYFKIVSYIYIFSFICAIIMYSFEYTNAAFSAEAFLKVQTFAESIDKYGEIRLYWLLSHKSRYAMYCLLGALFIINSKVKKKIKIFGVILSLVCVVLSNTFMGIVIYLMVLGIQFVEKRWSLNKILNKIKEYRKQAIYGGLGLVIFSGIGIGVISQFRDISTLGARTFIWRAGIEKVINNPLGLIQMPNDYWIKSIHEGHEYYFTNAHSEYINEFIESGMLLGMVFIITLILICKKYFESKDLVFMSFLIIYMGIYFHFESVNSYEMPYILYVSFALFYWRKIDEKQLEEEIERNEEIDDNSMYV